MTRTYVDPVGFVSLPDALQGVDAAVEHVAKVSVAFAAELGVGEAKTRVWHSPDKLLVDFGALASAPDFDKIKRDCEILSRAIDGHRETIGKAVAALRKNTDAGIREAEKLFHSIGLDEGAMT